MRIHKDSICEDSLIKVNSEEDPSLTVKLKFNERLKH